MDPRMYYENRSKAIKALLDSNTPNPYPHKFLVDYDDKQFVKDYEHIKVSMGSFPLYTVPLAMPRHADANHPRLLVSPVMSTAPRSSGSPVESTADDPSAS